MRRSHSKQSRQPGQNLAEQIVQQRYASYRAEQKRNEVPKTAEIPASPAQQPAPTPDTGHHSPKCSVNFGLAHCDCRDKGK